MINSSVFQTIIRYKKVKQLEKMLGRKNFEAAIFKNAFESAETKNT